jgi:hypothetical protein
VRLVAASVVTLLALPLLISEATRGRTEGPVAAVGPAAGLASAARPAAPARDDAVPEGLGNGHGYLDNGSVTTVPPPSTIDIAVKAPAGPSEVTGKAEFKRWTPGSVATSSPCAIPQAPRGAVVTVTNLDNGQSAACVNVSQAEPPAGAVIVVDTSVFEELADLVQAPIPVKATW